jgi:hypothetical protein
MVGMLEIGPTHFLPQCVMQIADLVQIGTVSNSVLIEQHQTELTHPDEP